MLFGGSSYNPPSRFLKEVPEGLVTMAGKRVRTGPVDRAAATGPPTTVSPDSIGPGDRVRHLKWGLGTVREVVGEGDRAEAEVMFDTQGKKRLLLAWAPLEKA
jgi:DNA helicase-2/ATP-dependent DNA helicase PcrA